ncbi:MULTISPECIES: hypothetical protein [unclassified Agarivorans]|nr:MULTISPECIES: hypothetical protein [unclassified Agarivorans]MDO6684813.1 hypothetical protein [Agarivorans sp. 3_MG-2023]MDO6715026.1 hypothetical protein [Agarivorans sp. 2_MG-2023]
MTISSKYSVHAGWRLMLIDFGIEPAELLRLAKLRLDLFATDNM